MSIERPAWFGFRPTEQSPLRFLVRSFPLDAVAWGVAFPLAALLRFENLSKDISWSSIGWVTIAAVVLQLFYGWILMLYRGRYMRGSFESLRTLVSVAVLVGITIWIIDLVAPVFVGVPRTVPLISTALA